MQSDTQSYAELLQPEPWEINEHRWAFLCLGLYYSKKVLVLVGFFLEGG